MIAVYAIAQIKAEKIVEFEAVTKDLIAKSLQDKGCVFYGCGPVQGKNNTYTFVEQWQSMADLELHAQQPHFIDASTKLSDILSAELDINVVNLL